jgi:hypothetical protein
VATGSAAVTTLIEREASPIKRLKRFLSRYFYLCMALVMAGVAAAGLGQTVVSHQLHANPPRPPLLWFHAAVFSAWIVLFVAQSALVRVRKVSVHRALGWFGAALAATMVVSGVIVSVVMLRFEITVLHRETAAKFLPVLWCDMIIFGACMALAIYFRSDQSIIAVWFSWPVASLCKPRLSDFITSVITTSFIRRSTY